MTLLSQFLMLLLAVGASLGFCPPPEDILPCTCTVNEDTWRNSNLKVLCWKVDDIDNVRRALQIVKEFKISLEFRDSRLGSVPSDLFKGMHVINLSFYNCDIDRIGDVGRSAFEGLEDILESLTVRVSFYEDNPLTSLNVSGVRSLTDLEIFRENVKEVGNDWFGVDNTNLREVQIRFSDLPRLGDRAFAPLTNLEILWMPGNKIETVKRSMFPSPANHFGTVNLRFNKITSVPVDIFSNMPALEHVILADNLIQHIPEETWKPVWSKLTLLFLEDNPFKCDADIEWIFKESRPEELRGKCVSPDERKGLALDKLIEEKQKDT